MFKIYEVDDVFFLRMSGFTGYVYFDYSLGDVASVVLADPTDPLTESFLARFPSEWGVSLADIPALRRLLKPYLG